MTTIAQVRNAPLGVSLLTAGALVFGLYLYSFTIGPYPIPVETVVSVFLHQLNLAEKNWADAVELVVLDVRGPRIAAALLVGGALACAGATYQNLFRNPLVSPGVLGVSAGSCFGAASCWACRGSASSPWRFSGASAPWG